MKKLLALVLALVMTLSLCVTSNAAFDGEEYDYDEAVEVMAAVGVFEGDENGKFNGQAELTREQAAKLIAYLDLGKTVAEALPAVKVFNDVEANRWSAKYIAYCADAGYINGVGDGNFDPTGKLTGYAFGKMLLCVLGYDASIEGFTGASWMIKVAKLMESNDIAKSVDAAASAALTREAAAQYCFNALQATCVHYTDKGTGITVAGVEIKTGASDAVKNLKVSNYDYTAAATNDGKETTQELAEKLYKNELQKDAAGADAFGRPASKWTYTKNNKTTTCGSYLDAATYTLEGKVTAKKFYETIGAEVASQAGTINYYVDGKAAATDSTIVANKKNDSTAACGTDAGTVAYIYVDTTLAAGSQVKIYVVNTYIGTVKKVTAAAADGTKRFVTLTDGKTFTTEDFAAKDVVLYTYTANAGTPAIQSMTLAEKVEGTYTKNVNDDTFTVDGKDYKKSSKGSTSLASAALNKKVSFYVDAQGNIMKDIESTAAADEYILVLGNSAAKASSEYLKGAATTYEVYGVLADGTAKTFTAKKQAGGAAATDTPAAPAKNAYADKAYVYELDDDGYIELTVADAAKDNGATKVSDTSMNGAKLNSDTIFVFVEKTSSSDATLKTATVKTGNKNFGSTIAANTALVCADDGVAKVVFVEAAYADDSTETGNLVYLSGSKKTVTTKDDEGTKYSYTYEAYNTDGDKLTVSTKTSTDYQYQVWKYNEDNSLSAVKTSASGIVTAIDGDTITVGASTYLTVTDDTKEVFLNDDVELAVGQTITYVLNSDKTKQIDYLWVTADQVTYTLTLTGAGTTTAYEVIKGADVVNTIKLEGVTSITGITNNGNALAGSEYNLSGDAKTLTIKGDTLAGAVVITAA